jgi:hypothetical protein
MECPSSFTDCESCIFLALKGSVRDKPDVGVKKCLSCEVVIHNSDLREMVDYSIGTMWDSAKDLHEIKEQAKGKDIVRRQNLIMEFAAAEKVETYLDFGCGKGEVIDGTRNFIKSYGFELEKNAIERLQREEIPFFDSISSINASGIKFNLVSLFHVIEHLYEPRSTLESLIPALSENAIVIIETPNSNDALINRYDSESFQNFTYWSHHPIVYSSKALENLLELLGFEVLISTGVQRYGLANHLYWLAKGKPGGHEKWGDMFLESVDSDYASHLIRLGISDTLLVVGRLSK